MNRYKKLGLSNQELNRLAPGVRVRGLRAAANPGEARGRALLEGPIEAPVAADAVPAEYTHAFWLKLDWPAGGVARERLLWHDGAGTERAPQQRRATGATSQGRARRRRSSSPSSTGRTSS